MQVILGTGLSGMVGSAVVESMKDQYVFENLSLEVGVDITNASTVDSYVSKSTAEWILHFAAMTNVDKAEEDRVLGDQGDTWKVNVGATEILVEACKKYHKKLLYISTDFVFPGGEKVFTEEDTPSPIGWYAITKYEGEKRVKELGLEGLIIRLSFPYGQTTGPKKDFVGRFRELFQSKSTIVTPVDQVFTPTYMGDISKGIQLLMNARASGMYHLVGGSSVTSFEAATLIAKEFMYDESLIQKTTAAAFYHGRSPRPTNLRISNNKIQSLGLSPVTFQEGIALLERE